MPDSIYTITLADGTVFDNLSINGNNYIYPGSLDTSVFEDNLSPVTISDGETEEVHEHMEYVKPYYDDPGNTWFVLVDVPKSDVRYRELYAKLDYVAMMTDVEV